MTDVPTAAARRRTRTPPWGGKGENEVDVTYPFAPRRACPFHKNRPFLLQARMAMARSIFEDERVYRYNCDFYRLGLEIQYRF